MRNRPGSWSLWKKNTKMENCGAQAGKETRGKTYALFRCGNIFVHSKAKESFKSSD